MSDSTEPGLRLRMVVSILLLVLVTIAFLAGVWGVVFLFTGLLFRSSNGVLLATLFTGVLTVLLVYLEFRQRHSIAQRAEAEPVTSEAFPDLYRQVTRISQQYDVPVPEVAISTRPEPNAMVVGYRRNNTLLILSKGTLETLTDSELEAVLAHELAHIANRDAMVMTAVSLPAMLADSLRSRLISLITRSASSSGEPHGIGISGIHLWDPKNGWGRSTRTGGRELVVAVVITGVAQILLLTVSTVTWVLSRTIVAVLSRSRELAADRAAANVLGSPSQLSSALVSIDNSIEEMPRHDLREVSGLSAVSIVPLEPATVDPVMLGPDGNRTPFLWSIRAPLRRAKKRIFRTHPDTETRVERLSSFETH